ncbi:rab-GTPase-TBC domain-containing protein, partial [Vararia minispora EC-137]
SPAASSHASLPRSPVTTSSFQSASLSASAASQDGIEAHRQRELKWVTLMGSTKAAEARKNRKVRKLLQEGVPASVRYQVWAHLTDSRSKRLEGLYARLCARGRVGVSDLIERDVKDTFERDARLDPTSLVALLQAYVTMVPDIQYEKGLTYIAGQLLLQSPEEDAFWIFISLMDTHLRPYFAANGVQLDVDASLFAKAVEAVDPSVGKRLFVDYSIPPVEVVRPWFTSLFVEALPTEYFQRVWDIFLSEGVVFLFRVGLALLVCCRRTLLDTKGDAAVLALLRRPPLMLISSTPDTFIELVSSVKLKDDDIRKQRVKMEAQVKRQTQ